MSELTSNLIDGSGIVSPITIADEFHISIKEVAALSGLSLDTVYRHSRFTSEPSQKRLHQIVNILNQASAWCVSPIQTYAWYRSESISSFGDLTPEYMVKQGMSEAVLNYIRRINRGGYA